jgi:hypothetical protein
MGVEGGDDELPKPAEGVAWVVRHWTRGKLILHGRPPFPILPDARRSNEDEPSSPRPPHPW